MSVTKQEAGDKPTAMNGFAKRVSSSSLSDKLSPQEEKSPLFPFPGKNNIQDVSLGKTTWNSLETSTWEIPETRVSYHLHGKKQKFWLQNQMVCTLLFELGSFRKNIWAVFWGDAIFPPFSVGYPSCSGLPSHHVKFYSLISEMPTSGDLKSGDCLFFTTPPPRNFNETPPPRRIDPVPNGYNGNDSGPYMTSYMMYILSKFEIIVLMLEIIFVND